MTTPTDPAHGDAAPLPPALLDELLSAQADGCLPDALAELGLDEAAVRASLAGDAARARLAAFSAARGLLTVSPLDELARARLIRAALESVPAAARPARRTHSQRWQAIGAAAAALIVVATGTTLVVDARRHSEKSLNASRARNGNDSKSRESQDATGSPTSATTTSPGAVAAPSLPDIGALADESALAAVPASPSVAALGSNAGEYKAYDGSTAPARCQPPITGARPVAKASYRGRDVIVLIVTSTAERRVVAVDTQDCTVVADVPAAP